ncbi:MAG: molybdopterin-dependent oxidoreductase, partial [Candidatus Eisenbacteria bacterium]
DAAFLGGVLKALLERGAIAPGERAWIEEHTEGFAEVEQALAGQSWEFLVARSGSTRDAIERFATHYAAAKSAIFVWSMGITQHVSGADQVRAIVNLALARGMVGRTHTGLVPIRGHSGVQGGSEVGCVPGGLPGGRTLDVAGRAAMEEVWGFAPPAGRGLAAVEMIEAAHAGRLDAFFVVGGNFLETLPDPARVEEALARVPLRVHQDIVLTSAMLVDPADTVVVLPARTRYEQTGGGTETSTERRILMSPEIPGPRPAEARDEWRALCEVAARVRPAVAAGLDYGDAQAIRDEIARAVPFYRGIETLRTTGDQVQYGGPLLCADGVFELPGGRARFSVVVPADGRPPGAGGLHLTTRRGKQFNSIVHADRDPLTGARREDILISAEDAAERGLADGDPIVVRSAHGAFTGRARLAPLLPGNVQGFWPEVNGLLALERRDAASGVHDYGADVTIERGRTP